MNDQFRAGQHVHIARSGLLTSPVALAERFLVRAELSRGALFRELTGQGTHQRVSNKLLTYTQAQQQIHHMFSKIGLSPRTYCLHSLRSGGATHAGQMKPYSDYSFCLS